jgi:hypothetical protein
MRRFCSDADGLSLHSEQGGNRTEKPYSESEFRKGCSMPFGIKGHLGEGVFRRKGNDQANAKNVIPVSCFFSAASIYL